MIHRVLIVAFLVGIAGSAALSQPNAPSIRKLDNGLTVIVQEDHAADLVGVDVWVKAGSGNETDANNGVSHFIEHMIFSATAKREPGDMDLEMESLGATLDAHTSHDWAHFSTTVSSRYLDKALDVLSDALMNAQFREADLQDERPVILDEIAKKLSNPVAVCKDILAQELYKTHPYALPIEGTSRSIAKITRNDILDYYHKHYVAANAAVVIVGDVNTQEAVDAVGKAFQGLSSAAAPEVNNPTIDTSSTKQVVKSLNGPYKQDYLAIGFIGPSGADYSDICATDVMFDLPRHRLQKLDGRSAQNEARACHWRLV